MQDFGSEGFPLRASSLHRLVKCPWSAIVSRGDFDDSGPAADTGTAVHKAVEIYHKENRNVRLGIEAMKALAPSLYPLADLERAERHFRAYSTDPRNKEAEVILPPESEVTFTLPHETGPIYIRGHLDQLRRLGGRLIVHDIKTGKSKEGREMLAYYALQQAAYIVGAATLLGERVYGAALIRTEDYFKRTPGPVFWEMPWSWREAEMILDGVRHVVGMIRKGVYWLSPGEQCDWCPQGGVTNCAPKLLNLEVRSGPPRPGLTNAL